MATSQEEVPWHAAYPPPTTTPLLITRQQVLQLFKDGKQAGRDFVLVDLRRTDFEGGTIKGAINLPAQSLYPTLPTLYTLFKSSGVSKVIWYCGSSRGRGPRGAAWFADHLKHEGDDKIESLVLEEGIKGWATAGQEYTDLMVAYESEKWP